MNHFHTVPTGSLCEFHRIKHRDKFNSEFDRMLIEQIIAGIVYPEVQKQLLAEYKKITININRKLYEW